MFPKWLVTLLIQTDRLSSQKNGRLVPAVRTEYIL